MFCSYCGKQIKESDRFCSYCGSGVQANYASEGMTFIPEKTHVSKEKEIIITLLDKKIRVSPELVEYNNIWKMFVEYAHKIVEEYNEFYRKKVFDFDGIHYYAIPKLHDYIKDGIDFAVAKLKLNGVESISAPELWDLCNRKVDEMLATCMGDILLSQEAVLKYSNDIREMRSEERAARTQWVGGGFGIKGALVGAAKAELMNLGTNAIRGVGDAWVDAGDRKMVQQRKMVIYENAEDNIMEALYYSILSIAKITLGCLQEHDKLSEILFDDEREEKNLDYYWERAKRDYKLISMAKDAAFKLIDANPYNLKSYYILYYFEKEKKPEIRRCTGFFGVDYPFLINVDEIDKERFAEALLLNEGSLEELKYKEGQLRKILNEAALINGQKQLEEVEKKLNQMKEKYYVCASKLLENKEYEEAIEVFAKIKGYSDSEKKIEEIHMAIRIPSQEEMYREACQKLNERKYQEALNLFISVVDYKDSKSKLKQCREALYS